MDNELELEDFIIKFLPEIDKIDSYEEFLKACEELRQKIQDNRPVEVIKGHDKIQESLLDTLKEQHFPLDFIDWHQRFGSVYLWLEKTKIVTSTSVVRELESGYWEALTNNGFFVLTTDGSGNAYVIDTNMDTPEIKFADHGGYVNQESIEYMYEEVHEFDYDQENKKWIVPENMERTQIFDEQGEFLLKSPYILEYLTNTLKTTGHTTFLDFLKGMLKEGVKDYFAL